MRHRQIAASVLELLRFQKDSPFFGRIKGLGASGEGCNISQAAIISLVEKSMKQGVLADFAGTTLEDTDLQSCANTVKVFFSGVRKVWPDAWEGSPRSSRLVHGAGLFAMGGLMDLVMSEVDPNGARAVASVKRRIEKIERKCAWTSGRWKSLRCDWNDLQNTSQDKRRLTEFILTIFNESQ